MREQLAKVVLGDDTVIVRIVEQVLVAALVIVLPFELPDDIDTEPGLQKLPGSLKLEAAARG